MKLNPATQPRQQISSFAREIKIAEDQMKIFSRLVRTEKWQGVEADRSMATYELRHYVMRCLMPTEDLQFYRDEIQPNCPWADDHFEKDRVCGEPLNPGETWQSWPYGHSANKFRDDNGQFNHSYAERYWPKFAGRTDKGELSETVYDFRPGSDQEHDAPTNSGIRYPYGDLADVVKQLAREPHTRQAILPVFFPEDTGAVHGGRVPCSLFYQFLVRNNEMDVSYVIRSCDMVRHFRDDIYLTVRLLLWILAECRKLNPFFNDIKPGSFVMLITSLHMFQNDALRIYGGPIGDQAGR
jgi:hypothetical protein